MSPNLIPNAATKALAQRMIDDAHRSTGPDAAALLSDVAPDQLYALVGILLTRIKRRERMSDGRLRLVDQFSEVERRAANRRYAQGDRDPLTVAQRREYVRVGVRRARARAQRRAEGRVA